MDTLSKEQTAEVFTHLMTIHKRNEELNNQLDTLQEHVLFLEAESTKLRNSKSSTQKENNKLKEEVKRLSLRLKQLEGGNSTESELELAAGKVKKPTVKKRNTKTKLTDSGNLAELSDQGSKKKLSAPSILLDYTDSDIMLSSDGTMSAASLDKIILALCSPNNREGQLMNIFLLTFRVFLNPDGLFIKLVNLWTESVSYNTTDNTKDFEIFKIKFMNLLKTWVEKHPYDFTPELLDMLSNFIDSQNESIGETTCNTINKLILRHKERTEKKIVASSITPPHPILPNSDFGSHDFILVLDPLEIARQMTLRDEAIYKTIRPRECMNQAWNKPATSKEMAPNILKLIDKFNRISGWVTKVIVSEMQAKRRKSIMTRIIKIAQRLRELHNYNSLMAIIAALESASIARMKKSWEALDSSHVKSFQDLKLTMSAEGSYKNFRNILKTESPPAIPYIGVYLGDLTFIEDGNPDLIMSEEKELINLLKMKMLSKVIEEIRMYQNDPYNIEYVGKIQKILEQEEDTQLSQQELFDLSLKAEPRSVK